MADINDLKNTFELHQHPENQAPMAKYMRNHFPFYGIKSVERRKVSRHFLTDLKQHTKKEGKVDWVSVYALWELDQREFQYVGMDYLRAVDKYLIEQDIDHLKYIITTKSWWDAVDSLAKAVGTLVQNYSEHKDTMLLWSTDNNFWLRRTAIIHQLGFGMETDTELLSSIILNNMGSDEFFINKAIGWILRDYGKHNRAFVEAFIEEHEEKLDKLSIREATKNF